jgi:protein-tyrosine phosphatase
MNKLKAKLSLTNVKIPVNTVQQDEARINNINRMKADCNHIIDEIYLSGYQKGCDYEFLKANNFTHIVNCASASSSYSPVFYDDFMYLKLDIKDEPGFDIVYFIYQCIDFIENGSLGTNRKILFHCYEGVSRAPTILATYLIWKYNFTKDYVVNLLKEKRHCVDINLGFLYQLDRWNENRLAHFYSKAIKIEKCGNISVTEMSKVIEEDRMSLYSILVMEKKKLLRMNFDKSPMSPLASKFDYFINILQMYEKLPNVVKIINY